MDWITTAGKTLDEAKSNALDQLGIVADEAEFDIVNDVEKGLFGRVKTEAKIRARVRPRQPAAKDENRSRNGSRSRSRQRSKGNGQSKQSQSSNNQTSSKGRSDGRSQNSNNNQKSNNNQNSNSKRGGQNAPKASKGDTGRNNRTPEKAAAAAGAGSVANRKSSGKKETVEATVTREEQEEVAVGFLEGLLNSFEMTGDVSIVEEEADDGAIELAVGGSELGLLVGQKGNTLSAVQELTRTVVQRNAEGAKTDRLRVDVAGYRARRTAALREFAQKLATEVADTGNEKLLEPMGPADRKVVHDAINDIDGVETGSEGQEPRRRVVIRPIA